MDIGNTSNSLPVCQCPYPLIFKHHEWVKSEIETLEDAGVMHKIFSQWTSPVVVVAKKSEKRELIHRRI